MKLVHYSHQPLGEVVSLAQLPWYERLNNKPRGLWLAAEYADGDGWRELCIQGRMAGLIHVHDVDLAPTARILRLSGVDEILAFTAEYLTKVVVRRSPEALVGYTCLDWEMVAGRWQGIIIAPHVSHSRFRVNATGCAEEVPADCNWYWGWDCASGCIWDATAIAKVTLREIVPSPVESILSARLELPGDCSTAKSQQDYDAGYQAGQENSGAWGSESQSWLEGYSDARDDLENGPNDARFGRPDR